MNIYIRNPKQMPKLVYYNNDKSIGLVVERQNGFDTANILSTQGACSFNGPVPTQRFS